MKVTEVAIKILFAPVCVLLFPAQVRVITPLGVVLLPLPSQAYAAAAVVMVAMMTALAAIDW